MQKKYAVFVIIGWVLLMTVSACTPEIPVDEWKVFAIEEYPAIDLQFRLPPEWHVDYAPTADVPGQWDVALVPPLCSKDQETEFSDNCIALTIRIKGEEEYDKLDLLSVISQSMTLNETGSEETILIGQNSFEVNGLTVQRYNHKLFIGEEEVQMSFFFIETDSAFYLFVSELPYDQRDGEVAEQFSRLIESIDVID